MPRKLDLRTGRPVWMAYRAPSVPTARLERDAKADVLVVGLGISGPNITRTEGHNGEGFYEAVIQTLAER